MLNSNSNIDVQPSSVVLPSIKNLFIFHQNIRSLRKNFDCLVCNLQSFSSLPNLIFLSEIWIKENEIKNFAINGYNLYACCNNNYRAGGVAVYVADNVKVKISNNFNLQSADVILTDLIINGIKISIICV